MFYPRMSAPGVMIRCVLGREKAVLAFASFGLVVTAASQAYRIIPLGAKPQTAFFMGVLWCGRNSLRVPPHRQQAMRECCQSYPVMRVSRNECAKPRRWPDTKALGAALKRKHSNRPHHKTPMNSRAAPHAIAARLNRRLGRKDRPASHPAARRAACVPRDRARCACMGGTKRTSMNRIPPSKTAASEAGTTGLPPLGELL